MSDLAVINDPQDLTGIIRIVTDSVSSENAKRAYGKALIDFLDWYKATGKHELNKAIVQEYKTVMQSKGWAAATVNLRLSAIRKLAIEAADNALIDPTLAQGIGRIKGVKKQGTRTGNWLTKEQAQSLLMAPNITTLKGLRDRALLAVLLGCGLRRSEMADLTFEHIQQREGRWVIVDLIGKGNRVRSVPMSSWTKAAIDAYSERLPEPTGRVFRRMRKDKEILRGDQMSDQAIADTVKLYAETCGVDIAAHDLRRTAAKLAKMGGAPIEQIQFMLGHASLTTTERYLGMRQDFTNAPCDKIDLHL